MEEKQIIREFTLEEALEIAGRPTTSGNSSRSDHNGRDWNGASYEASMQMAVRGDPRNAVKIKQRLGQFAKLRGTRRPTQHWDTAGSSVDMGRFLHGDPECMVETRKARRTSPVIKLAIERCITANVSPATIEATGTSVLAAVEALRTAGVPSEVWVTFTCAALHRSYGAAGDIYSLQVLIQESGRPIDIDRLAFWTCNPSALRRIAFAIEEQEPREVVKAFGFYKSAGYGYPRPTVGDFDEIAPSAEYAVTQWLTDVMQRRAGTTLLDD